MTVGEGIFSGAFGLGLVGLYAVTKDRWKWRRIAKWSVGATLALFALVAAGIWATGAIEGRARPQTAFGNLAIASTEADVRFAKGEPSMVIKDGPWVYYAGSGSAQMESAAYVVRFRDGKVRSIGYQAAPDQIITPDLLGFTIGSPYSLVIDKLGLPDHVSTSANGLERMVSYSKLNTFYTFEKAEVRELGIYDPATGPMEFSKAASAPEVTPSSPQSTPSKPKGRTEEAPEVKPFLDHCAPGLLKAERMKRLAQYGSVREAGSGRYEAGGRSVTYYESELLSCQ